MSPCDERRQNAREEEFFLNGREKKKKYQLTKANDSGYEIRPEQPGSKQKVSMSIPETLSVLWLQVIFETVQDLSSVV